MDPEQRATPGASRTALPRQKANRRNGPRPTPPAFLSGQRVRPCSWASQHMRVDCSARQGWSWVAIFVRTSVEASPLQLLVARFRFRGAESNMSVYSLGVEWLQSLNRPGPSLLQVELRTCALHGFFRKERHTDVPCSVSFIILWGQDDGNCGEIAPLESASGCTYLRHADCLQFEVSLKLWLESIWCDL